MRICFAIFLVERRVHGQHQADSEEKAIWVCTTDSAGFYATVGFKLAGEKWIAKEWHGGPIPVRIVRLPLGPIEHCERRNTNLH